MHVAGHKSYTLFAAGSENARGHPIELSTPAALKVNELGSATHKALKPPRKGPARPSACAHSEPPRQTARLANRAGVSEHADSGADGLGGTGGGGGGS
eukprot:2393898-Prymnesium_polylepis.1